MKKIFLLACLLILATWSGYSQNLSKAGVIKMNIRSSGPIFQNDQVVGYYYFIKVDKKDRKNHNYILSVYDENLREINSIDITRPSTYVLIDGAFNGDAFGFLFYDSRGKSVELMAYDRTLKQTGSIKKPVTNKILQASYNTFVTGNEPSQAYLVPVANKGFVFYGLKAGSKMQYETEFYNNALKSLWVDKANDKTAMNIEIASEAFQTVDYIGSIITKKKGAASKDIETDLVVQAVEGGRNLFRIPLETEKYSVSFSDVYFNDILKQFVVFGEYHNKGDKELKTQSLGFITLSIDLNGKIVQEKINSWQNEISKATPVNERAKFDGSNTSILFHDIVRTADGKMFVIGEQYKKVASAAGITSQVLAASLGGRSNVATSQINVYNMVIFEFNSDYSIAKVHIFEKDKNVVTLPAGATYYSSKMLSYYAKAVGGFDYAFTQLSPNQNTFYVSYINYDVEKGERGKNVLGTIVYTPEKVFTVDKLALNRKSTLYFVYRAKDGYVLVTEYFKKEKRLDSRLEKVNY